MCKVILYIAMTLDGYIARKNGVVDFLDEFDTGEDHGFQDLMDRIDAIIMGGRTFREYSDHPDFYDYYKGKKLYVMSRTIDKLEDANVVSGDPIAIIQQISENIWLLGGAQIIHEFYSRDLIDEYIISVIPKVIGEGIPLFQSEVERKLTLTDTIQYTSGIVNLHYTRMT